MRLNEVLAKVRKQSFGNARSAGYAVRAQWRKLPAQRQPRLLLLAWYDPFGLGTIAENVHSIRQFSRHHFDVLNLYGLLPLGGVRIPSYVKLRDYDGVFIHCTLSYNPDTMKDLDARLREKLADYSGLKIVMKQDENFRVNGVVDYLQQINAHMVVTCLEPAWVRSVYPEERLPGLRFFHARTGYVTAEMRSCEYTQEDDRPIDVGYRGSLQPFAFGRRCYEKRQIGDVFQRICAERGLKADISSRREDRRFGKDWFRFLGRSKATLGVESGGSVFDFTGQLERQCDAYLAAHPDADFETVSRLFLAPREGNVPYGQVSPRHFEAAACRTVQILYEGQYSGIFLPGRHYLSLRRDLGNLSEIIERVRDPAERKRLTENAFQDIIMNDEYLYSSFVDRLDDAIDRLL